MTERAESFTLTESVARWAREGRAAYEAEREALQSIFLFVFFVDWCKVFQGQTIIIINITSGGTGIFFSFRFFRFRFYCFCGAAAVPCGPFSHVRTYQVHIIQHIEIRKSVPYLGYVRTYVRTVCDSWHDQVANLQLQQS